MIKKISQIVSFQVNLTMTANANVYTNLGKVLFPFDKNVRILKICASPKVLNGDSAISFISFLRPIDKTGANILNFSPSSVPSGFVNPPFAEIIHNTNYPTTFENLEFGGLEILQVFLSRAGTTTTTSVGLVFAVEVEQEIYVPDPVV